MEYPNIKDFHDFVLNAYKIQQMYGGVYSPDFNLKYVHEWREYIYSRTNISKSGRHAMWEFMNYDIDIIGLVDAYYKSKNENKKKKKN